MAVLADVIGKSRARRDIREITPQRDAAMQQMSTDASALPMFKLRQEQKRLEADQALAATKRADDAGKKRSIKTVRPA